VGNHFQIASECVDQTAQRGDLHIRLVLQLREAGLLDAQGLGHLHLTQPHRLADFPEKQTGEDLLGPPVGAAQGGLAHGLLTEFIE
jgi:hypothetical protein